MTILGRAAVPTAVLAAALALAGCGGSDAPDPDPTVGAVVPGAAPSASPRPTAPAQVDEKEATPEGGASASTDNDLPDGFPDDEIPVVDGTVESGSRGKAGGPYAYSVIVRVPGTSAAKVMAGITGQLTGAGFAAESGPATDAISSSTFRNARYEVGVNVIRAKGRTTVTYVVVKKG